MKVLVQVVSTGRSSWLWVHEWRRGCVPDVIMSAGTPGKFTEEDAVALCVLLVGRGWGQRGVITNAMVRVD